MFNFPSFVAGIILPIAYLYALAASLWLGIGILGLVFGEILRRGYWGIGVDYLEDGF